MDCTIRVAKTKALISFAVTAKLICVFVLAYAESRVSHNEAHISQLLQQHGRVVALHVRGQRLKPPQGEIIFLHLLHYEILCFCVKHYCYLYSNISLKSEPRHEKTCLQGFPPGMTQKVLYRQRRWLEAWNLGFWKKRDCMFYVRVAET